MDKRYKISNIKVSIVKTQSAGADYTDHAAGHWINDTIIANPMSVYSSFQDSRSSWGMDVLKGIFIEVETEGVTKVMPLLMEVIFLAGLLKII